MPAAQSILQYGQRKNKNLLVVAAVAVLLLLLFLALLLAPSGPGQFFNPAAGSKRLVPSGPNLLQH